MDFVKRSALIILLLSFGLSGCSSIGPLTVVHDRFDYTGAIGDSWKQQMLINTVKMRFVLFGLLIVFTFSGGASRLNSLRQLIAEEANDIGTAYLRLDLLPAEAQPALRVLFRNYADLRLAVYRKLPDIDAAKAELARSEEL